MARPHTRVIYIRYYTFLQRDGAAPQRVHGHGPPLRVGGAPLAHDHVEHIPRGQVRVAVAPTEDVNLVSLRAWWGGGAGVGDKGAAKGATTRARPWRTWAAAEKPRRWTRKRVTATNWLISASNRSMVPQSADCLSHALLWCTTPFMSPPTTYSALLTTNGDTSMARRATNDGPCAWE